MHVYTLHDATSKAIMRVSSCMYTVYIQVYNTYMQLYLFTHVASYKIKLRISITTESPNVTSRS